MEKIKILRLIARLNVGGPAIHVAILSAGLDSRRYETVLACGRLAKGEADMSDYARSLGVEPRYIGGLGRNLSLVDDARAFVNIYRLISGERPDIIHTHTAKAGTLGRAAAIVYNSFRLGRGRVRLVHTFHGHVFEGYFNKFASRFFLSVERMLSRFTDTIITVSESVKKELVDRRACPEGKIRVVPLGFDLNGLLSLNPPPDDPSVIGIVGRLEPVKNHKLFLEAAALLLRDRPALKFKIIGGGMLRDELAALARELGIGDHVEFCGWQRDLAGIYSGLDIVALTSVNEGTPVSLIEAMAAARPVVAACVGGVQDLLGGATDRHCEEPVENYFRRRSNPDFEIASGKKRPRNDKIGNGVFSVGERGILVRSGDASAFAAGICRLIDSDETRRDFSREGREFVRSKFTKERLVRDIEKIYGEMGTVLTAGELKC